MANKISHKKGGNSYYRTAPFKSLNCNEYKDNQFHPNLIAFSVQNWRVEHEDS